MTRPQRRRSTSRLGAGERGIEAPDGGGAGGGDGQPAEAAARFGLDGTRAQGPEQLQQGQRQEGPADEQGAQLLGQAACGRRGPRDPWLAPLDAAVVRARLAKAETLGVREVSFTGGEPFLHPEVLPLLEAALASRPRRC